MGVKRPENAQVSVPRREANRCSSRSCAGDLSESNMPLQNTQPEAVGKIGTEQFVRTRNF